jgi:hypothetical protein
MSGSQRVAPPAPGSPQEPAAEPPLTLADQLTHEDAAREQHAHGVVHDRAACSLCPTAPAREAATPPEVLAAELETEANTPGDSPRSAYRALMLHDFAELLRDRLAPAHAALEAERDHYRATLTDLGGRVRQLQAEKSHLEARVTALTQALEREAAKDAELAKRDKALEALDRVVISHERSMFAALIDVASGSHGTAKAILTEALDGFDGPKWNGTETGIQWLERTREARDGH